MITNRIGLYIHIPFCNQICPYCDFYKMVGSISLQEQYIDSLIKEMKLKKLNKIKFNTLYIGGGTPSALPINLIDKLLDNLESFLDLSLLEEFTIELNPEDINEELIKMLSSHQINRVSIGIQTLNPTLQNIIKRYSNKDQIRNIVELLNKYNLTNYNFDLIYGIVGETLEILKNDIDSLLEFNPKHLSIYALILEEHTIFNHLIKNGEKLNVSDDLEADMYQMIYDYLTKKGFNRYETSNFSLEGYESKHNNIYWTSRDYYSLGVGSTQRIKNTFYYQNSKIRDYINSLNNECLPNSENQKLNDNELMEYYVMLILRTTKGIDLEDFNELYKKDFYEAFPTASELIKQGYCEADDSNYYIKPEYFFVANKIIGDLIN